MSNTVTSQPGSGFVYTNEWQAGLFECCSDCKSCLYAYFCMPCFMCSLFTDADECALTPFLCPASVFMLRAKLRANYKIEGALWKDVCTIYFCGFCALIQMANEMRLHGDSS